VEGLLGTVEAKPAVADGGVRLQIKNLTGSACRYQSAVCSRLLTPSL
jgi:hypothetical protein